LTSIFITNAKRNISADMRKATDCSIRQQLQ